jgi:hypothetical protein
LLTGRLDIKEERKQVQHYAGEQTSANDLIMGFSSRITKCNKLKPDSAWEGSLKQQEEIVLSRASGNLFSTRLNKS